MEKPLIELGYAWETRSGALDAVEEALRRTEGVEVRRRRLYDLAGPNDVIQIISDNWLLALLAWASGSFFGQLLKNAADALWKRKSDFASALRSKPELTILGGVSTAAGYGRNFAGAHAIVAVPIQGNTRNAGLELTSMDPAELAWQLGLLALMADRVQTFLDGQIADRALFQNNGDASIKLEVSDDGRISVRWSKRVASGGYTEHVKTFTPGEDYKEGL